MDKRLLRKQLDKLEPSEKRSLLQVLAERYGMVFQKLRTFSRWGNGIATGVFQKDGREFVFIPGDTVTLGWQAFFVGPDPKTTADFSGAFEEFEYTGTIEDFLRPDMSPVRQAAISPMLVARRLEEICWEPIAWEDERLRSRTDWMDHWREFAKSGGTCLNIVGEARFRLAAGAWQASLYHEIL